MSKTLKVLGTNAIIFPVIVLVIAVLLVLFSNYATKREWLA